MARYDAGETLASIARTYDCSPPAISYVVSRSRARVPDAEAAARPPSASEPQLIKAAASDSTATTGAGREPLAVTTVTNGHADGHAAAVTNGSTRSDAESHPAPGDARATTASPTSAGERAEHNAPRAVNGFARDGAASRDSHLPGQAPRAIASVAPPPHTNGTDQRRTLHLSLGNGGQASNGAADPFPGNRANFPNRPQPQTQQPQPSPAPPPRGPDTAAAPSFSEIRPAFDEPVRQNDAAVAPRKEGAGREGGSFIDKELRARVDTDIAAFLAAFDAALEQDSQESRSALREATDRLLRAGARTRIELERLEARIPLPPRDSSRNTEPAWRHR